LHPESPSVSHQLCAPESQEWTRDAALGGQRRETARARAAQDAHEHRFDLIVGRVGGANDAIKPRGDAAKKVPTRRAEIGLARQASLRAFTDGLDS
jgi:hypothetical protein